VGRQLFDLITEGKLEWNPLPDVYDVFVYPNLQVKVCKGEANFRTALTAAFLNEKSNIEQYFRDLRTASSWASRYLVAMVMPPLLARMVRAVNRFTGDLPL
jgi:all-trans-retinol 13,14-reductase